MNTWHKALKEKLAEPLKRAGYPSFSAIMKYCDADPGQVIGKKNKGCAPNAFFGRCFHKGKCTKDHGLPTDAEVKTILSLCDKFIKDPEGIKQGK